MKRHTTDRASWSSPNPTSPVIENRVPFYAPILRVSHNSRPRTGRHETRWGWVELSGPVLTMKHWAILKMSMARAVKKQVFQGTGGMAVWFDTYRVKKELGAEYSGGKGHRLFLQRMEDMRKVKLTVRNKRTGRIIVSGILDWFSYTYDEDNQDQFAGGIKTARSRQGNCLHEIRISPNYMQFFREDLRVHYDPLVPEIVSIPDGTIQAVILFFMTHKEKCQYPVSQVMEIIGAIEEAMTKGTVSKIMAKPEKFKTELENLGIFLEGKMLRYERHPKVFFTNPPAPLPFPASTGAVINAEQGPEATPIGTALEATPEAIVSPRSPEK